MSEQEELIRQFYDNGKVEDCPVYDLHGHMGPFCGIRFPRHDPASMVHAMDRAGVKLLVFCHHAALFCPEIGNAASIDAVRRFPEKLRAYCGINPNYPDIAAHDLDTFDQYPDVYVGLKLLADYHGYSIADGRYKAAWALAERKRLLVLLHTWGGSGYDGPIEIRKVAGRYPNARILLGHSCHGEWDQAIDLAREFPNVYLELCAVMDDRGILDRFVAELGSERIVYGTDLPWFNEHYYIGAVLGADITDEDRRNIFCRNAQHLLSDLIR